MSDGSTPVIKISPQVLTATSLDGYPTVLVDDTNYLVDDTRSLVGSQTTAVANMKVRIIPDPSNAKIHIRR